MAAGHDGVSLLEKSMAGEVLQISILGISAFPFEVTEVIILLEFTADTGFAVEQ